MGSGSDVGRAVALGGMVASARAVADGMAVADGSAVGVEVDVGKAALVGVNVESNNDQGVAVAVAACTHPLKPVAKAQANPQNTRSRTRCIIVGIV